MHFIMEVFRAKTVVCNFDNGMQAKRVKQFITDQNVRSFSFIVINSQKLVNIHS